MGRGSVGQASVADQRHDAVGTRQRPLQRDRRRGDRLGRADPVAEVEHILGVQRIADPERRLVEGHVGPGRVGPEAVGMRRVVPDDTNRPDLRVGMNQDTIQVIILRGILPDRRDVVVRSPGPTSVRNSNCHWWYRCGTTIEAGGCRYRTVSPKACRPSRRRSRHHWINNIVTGLTRTQNDSDAVDAPANSAFGTVWRS